MSLLPANAPFVGIGAVSVLGLILAANMSRLRVVAMKGGPGLASPHFKHWHLLQLNNAEYLPVYIGLFLAVHMSRKEYADEPGWTTAAGDAGILLGVLGSYLFIFGASLQEPGVPLKSPPLVRASGGTARYLALIALVTAIVGRCW